MTTTYQYHSIQERIDPDRQGQHHDDGQLSLEDGVPHHHNSCPKRPNYQGHGAHLWYMENRKTGVMSMKLHSSCGV